MLMKKVSSLLIALVCASLCAAQAQNVRRVSLTTNDIIYDAHTAKIYASIPSSAGAGGNSITSVDPATGTVGTPVYVGSEPNNLAVSDNGQFLYVGLDGAAAVRRVSLPAQTAGLQFSLGSDSFLGPYYVEDMQVLPGNAHALAVSEKNLGVSPANAGVAIFDDGVQRAQRLGRGANGYASLAFSSDSSILYTYDNEVSSYGFCRLGVDSSGVSLLSTADSVIKGFRQTISSDTGSVYASDGQIINPATQTLVGNFSGTGTDAWVRPDVANGRVFFLSNDGGQNSTATIQAYDSTTFLPVGALTIPNVIGAVGDLFRWGADGLAFRTGGGQIFLIRTSLIPNTQPTPASVTLAPAQIVGGGVTAGIVTLSAPASSGGVAVWLSSSNPDVASLPASLTVAAGQTSATFTVATRPVTSKTSITVSAVSGGTSASAILTVQAPTYAHILWTYTGGQASVWNVAPDGSYTYTLYGPYAGWTATALSVGPDGNVRLLWTHAGGMASLWNLADAQPDQTCHLYGPFEGWAAVSLAVGPDNTPHLLWAHPLGLGSIWNVAPDGSYTYHVYGAYAGWSATALSVGPDGNVRLLWSHAEGMASLWNLADAQPDQTCHLYGPFEGWAAASLAAGP